jgi:hypothetical protein
MQQVVFEPWLVGTTQATLSWRIERPEDAPPLAAVRHRLWRDRETPVWQVAPDAALTGSATHDVTNFQGMLRGEVALVDALGQVETFLTEIAVSNRVAASAPDWLALVAQTDTHVTLRWGQRYASETTVSWLVYAQALDAPWQLVALLPSETLEATVPWDASRSVLFEVRGSDAQGREAAGGRLQLSARTGATAAFGPISLTATELLTTLAVAEGTSYTALSWRVLDGTAVLASGTELGPVRAVIANYQGTLDLEATVVDGAGRTHQLAQQVRVFNRMPRRPVITLHSLGDDFIRLSVSADPADRATVGYLDLEGLGLTVRKAAPTLHTYAGLQPDTVYAFRARAITPGGMSGPWSTEFTVRTLQDFRAATPGPSPLVPGPLLAQITPWLQGALGQFFLQLVSDTRIRDPLSTQVVDAPDELVPFMTMVAPVLPVLGDVMREELPDQASYEASLLVDRLRDPISKLAALTERIVYGSVANRGG